MRRPLDDPFTRAAEAVYGEESLSVGPLSALLLAGEALAYDSYPLLVHEPRYGRSLAQNAANDLVARGRVLGLPPDGAPGFFLSRLRTRARETQADIFGGGSAIKDVELTLAELAVLPQAIRAAWAAGDAQAAGLLQVVGDCYAKQGRASKADFAAEGFAGGLLEQKVAPYFKQWRVGTPWARPVRPERLRAMSGTDAAEATAMIDAAAAAKDDLGVAVLAAFHHSLLPEGQDLTLDEIAALAEVTPGLLLAVLDGTARWFSDDRGWIRPLW